MPTNLTLPTNITPGVTATFEDDVEAAWAWINDQSKDTGLRNITSLLTNGWTATGVRLRRIVDRVFWEFQNLNGSAATDPTVISMSGITGFAPVSGNIVESDLWRGTSGTGFIRLTSTTVSSSVGFTFPATTTHTIEYRTASGWPTTLPGVAA